MVAITENKNLLAVAKQTGYRTLKSMLFLHYLVKAVKPSRVLELGTGLGCSAAFMASANSSVEIITIDNYLMDKKLNSADKCRDNLINCSVNDRVHTIEANCMVPLSLGSTTFEILFMDASHNLQDLHEEFSCCRRALQQDHIVIIDDYYSIYKGQAGVKDYVFTLSREYPACMILNYHQGMAVLFTNDKYLTAISSAIRKANHAK